MYDISNMNLSHVISCAQEIRLCVSGCTSMEQSSNKIVRFLYDSFIDPVSGSSAFPLVRIFKTHNFGDLDQTLQEYAINHSAGHQLKDTTKNLVLLASAGDHCDWNSRFTSQGHKAIPLASKEVVEQFPMIGRLCSEMPSVPMIVETSSGKNLVYVPS